MKTRNQFLGHIVMAIAIIGCDIEGAVQEAAMSLLR
jgi:hypothetical protein